RWSSNPAGRPGDGSTTASVRVSEPGVTWTCTVTDDAGCTGTGSVTTTVAPPLIPAIAPANPEACPGQGVPITADPGYAGYSWSSAQDPGVNGATTATVTASIVGATYTVTVTDA